MSSISTAALGDNSVGVWIMSNWIPELLGCGGLEGELTPRQIVEELDEYIVGQHAAKRSVAIALRNRLRRQQLEPEVQEDGALDQGRGRP